MARRTQDDSTRKDAVRDVRLANRPEIQATKRAGRQARRITRQASNRTQNIYSALGEQLAPLTGQYQQGMEGITSGYQQDLAGLAGMLGSTVPGVPSGEITAGTGLFGTIGAGTLGQLSSEQARNLAYNTSAQRQGATESAVTQRNYQQDLANTLKDFSQRRIDIAAGMKPEILSRMDTLSQIAFQQAMAQKDYELRRLAAQRAFDISNRELGLQEASDAAYQQWLISQGGRIGNSRRNP